MVSKKPYVFWNDAKQAAKDHSLTFGHAWIIGGEPQYRIAVGETAEDAPKAYLMEFKDGKEQ